MNKQAYEHIVGLVLSKTAEDLDAPAMIGNFVHPDSGNQNEYARQLKENAQKTIGPEILSDGTPSVYKGETIYKHIPGERAEFLSHPRNPVLRHYINPNIGPITLRDLLSTRMDQAIAGADEIFDENTVQHRDAQEYLKARGAENHQRYKDGTLWKNEPSKVPMPKTISQPDKLKQLDAVGAGMANARIPGYTKNNIVG